MQFTIKTSINENCPINPKTKCLQKTENFHMDQRFPVAELSSVL